MNGRLAWGLLGIVLCLVGAQGAWTDPARQVVVSELRGEVSVRIAESDWQPASPGMMLGQRDEVRTGAGAFAKLLVDREGATATLEMRPETHLRLHTLAGAPESEEKITLLDLAIGRVLVKVGKLTGESKFEIRTPTSTTGVRGTVFEVSVEEN